MLDFLEWYFPWAYLDMPLKVMAAVWLISTTLGVFIFVRSVVFNKPWLSMRHMRLPPEQTDRQSS